MRRKEFEVSDPLVWEDFLRGQRVGTLCWNSAAQIVAFPMNYLFDKGSIFLHGTDRGIKGTLSPGIQVTFSVFEELSILSTNLWPDNKASDITQFFRSVIVLGSCIEVAVPQTKLEILNQMVSAFQPGIPFEELSDLEAPILKHTKIWQITPDQISGKFKLGQNLSQEAFDLLLKNLKKRGEPLDLHTAKLMEALGRT